MNMDLCNRSVLITGSGSGIGRGISEGFLQEEALVILSDLNEILLNDTSKIFSKLYGKDKVLKFLGDLGKTEILDNLYQYIYEKTGGLDHLVCNIGSGKSVPPLEENVMEFQRMLEINLLNAVGVITHLLPLLENKVIEGCYPGITFVSSICGVEALGCPVAYASAKSALNSYAKNIAAPLGRKGIRVNVVSPGNIMFPGSTWEKKIAADSEKVNTILKNEVPLQCFGTVEDIANAVVFLASRNAKFVNGANWLIDGGQTRS
jgi:3-oxoacyl-[acyl-carrier protein] reductase